MSPLNIPVAPTTPTPIDVGAQEVAAAADVITQAPPVTPPAIGVTAQPLTPILFAGFTLAKIVLAITAGSILCLLLYLVWMESRVGTDVRTAYQQVLNPNRVGAQFRTISDLEKLSSDLSGVRNNSTAQLPAESLQNAQDVLKVLDELPSILNDQKTQLKQCIPLPPTTDASRNSKLDACLVILGSVRQSALEDAASATDARVAGDSADKIGAHRQSLHTFWVQAAQLILLNLLLPLLTALFGYIFGTQQAQKT